MIILLLFPTKHVVEHYCHHQEYCALRCGAVHRLEGRRGNEIVPARPGFKGFTAVNALATDVFFGSREHHACKTCHFKNPVTVSFFYRRNNTSEKKMWSNNGDQKLFKPCSCWEDPGDLDCVS